MENKEIMDVRQELPSLEQRTTQMAESIKDQGSFEGASRFLAQIKDFRKRVEEVFGPVVAAAYKAWKEACALRKTVDDPLDRCEQKIKRAMAVYYDAQERKRREDEARIHAEIKKQEEDSRISQAASLEKAGQNGAAEEVLNQPMAVPQVVLPKATAAGTTMRTVWSGELVDMMALVKAVAEGKAPVTLLQVNTVALNQMARAMKDAMRFPGVRAVSSTSVAA